MNISEKINQIFIENYDELDKSYIRKELDAMRNAQPPNYPTFMVGQDEVKAILKQQLSRCFNSKSFFHTVIVGEVGGGKTHLLNLIRSRFNDEDCYIVQFRAEETEVASYSFPKMIVASLFKRYYDDFKQSFLHIKLKEVYDTCDEDEIVNQIVSHLNININLAGAIYHYTKQEDKKSSAIRVLGGCENIKDINKLKINKLIDKDYMDVIELFLKYNTPQKHLLVMLDEFEHSYTLFTPAKRRDFLKGYKSFLDRLSKSGDWPFLLITAATVQYKGQLKDSLSRIDTALASRLEPQTLMLKDFDIASDEDFKNLYQEIAKRYKDVYNYDVGYNGYLKMRKKIFDMWDATSAQRKTYREVISSMISLMDEMEREKELFSNCDKEEQLEYKENSGIVKIQATLSLGDSVNEKVEDIYDLVKKEMEDKWNVANGKTKLTMVKKGLESLLEVYINNFNEIKIGSGKGGSSIILFRYKEETVKFIYIALQNLRDKLVSCKKAKEKQQSEQKVCIDTCFIYLPGEGIEEQVKYYPDIKTCNIDMERLDLIILGNKKDLTDELKEIILKNLQNLFNKMIGKGLK